jgi:hypothetical protein
MLVLAGVLWAPNAACAQSAMPAEPAVVVARFEVTNFEIAVDAARPYAITQSGDVTLGGGKVSDDAIEADLATASPRRSPALAITVDPRAALPQIAARLALFAAKRNLKLVDVETFQTFIAPSSPVQVDRPGSAFRGPVGPFELPVVVGLALDGQTCEASIADKAMIDGAFYAEAYAVLDRLVVENGGPDNTLTKTRAGRDIVARLQSGPLTPWRCVAGVILAVQRSGWPNVQLEVEVR